MDGIETFGKKKKRSNTSLAVWLLMVSTPYLSVCNSFPPWRLVVELLLVSLGFGVMELGGVPENILES